MATPNPRTTPEIARVPVRSSTLASLGYSPSHQILEAEFRSGEVYRFFMVPPSVHEELSRASSIGAFFNTSIRDRYPFIRLPCDAAQDLESLLEHSIAGGARALKPAR